MVLFKVKISEEDQFLYRTTLDVSVEATRSALVELFNLRQKLRRLKIDCEELAEYGPAKPPDAQCIDTYTEEPVEKGENYQMDPSGKRTGNGCPPTPKSTLKQTVSNAIDLIHKNRVDKGCPQTRMELLQAVDMIRGAVMICYPMGLPDWDPVRRLLENQDTATETYGYDQHEDKEMTLWFAGKEMRVGQALSAYLGDKEQTTAIIRLMKADRGAPSREPVIDEATYRGILSWSYKKQEEQQKLTENQDDDYLDAEWASTTSLKQHLNGTGRIRI